MKFWGAINNKFSSRTAKMFVAPLLLLPVFFLNSCEGAQALAQVEVPTNKAIIPLELRGKLMQSATIIGKTAPNAVIDAAGIITHSDEEGNFVFGFDRDAPETATIVITTPEGASISRSLKIEKREYKVSVVTGLPAATVNPPPEAMAKIKEDSALKQSSFISRDETQKGFLNKFSWPLQAVRVTSPWGAQRSLNNELQRPHYGIDLGGAKGTPIFAPADGKVILAKEGMHYEGGMVSIDHGQGLITNYLHQSKIIVIPGQLVKAGDKIGEIGAEGRATGPHLCWRMRWRERQLDPSLLTEEMPVITLN